MAKFEGAGARDFSRLFLPARTVVLRRRVRSCFAMQSIGLLFWASLLGSGSCAQVSPPGEVMLLISTDLSIPNDADTLHMTVERTGESTPFLDEAYALRGDAAPALGNVTTYLPGTVALASSDKMRGVVQVHLELLQNGVLRVQRDAALEVPAQGVKQLALPLDFLCAEGSPPTPCPSGETCEAGKCVDEAIADSSALADYVALVATGCFDVPSCFKTPITVSPAVDADPDTHLGCIVKNVQAGGAVNVNVGLVVDTSAVGNYGVCDASAGTCLVPLNRGGPGGWQTLYDNNKQPIAIGLPDAVCAAFQAGVIGGVQIEPASCPPKSASTGLCSAPALCVPASKICPTGWIGSSCSGTTVPQPNAGAPSCLKAGTDPAWGGSLQGFGVAPPCPPRSQTLC